MFEWAYDGVNGSIPRNVGPECANYLSLKRRIIETIFVSILIVIMIMWGYRHITLPSKLPYHPHDRRGRRILLILMSLVFGIEIGFKFTTADPSPMVTAVFRIHLNLLNGPFLAYLFPETESRRIFADKAMYYIQHGLMIVIPYYLLRLGGVYNVEPLTDISWSILGYGLNSAYHFWVLQAVAYPVQVNLSHVLCAAVSDPFEGQNYRLWAVVHQALLCPLLSKIFCYGCDFVLTKFPPTKVKDSLHSILHRNQETSESDKQLAENANASGNGHAHHE